MKVTIVRNAQTEYDYERKVIGRNNELLNDTGRRQVLKLKMELKDNDYDLCFVSPLTRCMETALVSVGDRIMMLSDDRITERGMGEYTDKSQDEYNAYLYWDYDLNKSDLGVEPIQDLFKRCDEFLKFLKDNYSDKSIIIVTHGEPYRAFRHLILGHKLKGKLLDGKIDNCQYEEYII